MIFQADETRMSKNIKINKIIQTMRKRKKQMKHIRRRCNNISYDHITISSLTSLPFQQQYKALLNKRTNNITIGYSTPHSCLFLNCHHFNLHTFQTNEINADFLCGETPLEFVKYWRSFRTPFLILYHTINTCPFC